MASELKWPVAKVRQQFVDFFKERDHTFAAGSPVVPLADPTLLFINSGMCQFKANFLGTADPSDEKGKLKRAVNSQPCIRAGGKHNDLDDVGRDTYHHTFFEMLGSWSFGDYFKKDAINWAWELLTKVYGFEPDRMYATYFEGNEEMGIPADIEARDLWLQYLPADRVLKGNTKDNFWEMGDVGPCGPCTEIHYDRIGGRNCADLVNGDDPMVIEVWNLVFMQFNRAEKAGKLAPLPAPHVDTGMGLERIASILQDVKSNYDTDAWEPIFAAIQKECGLPKSYKEETDEDVIVAYRVVADHIRCLTFALSDGAMPDKVGRGFVLRRIIRRAIRYGVQFLGAKTGFFEALVPAVIDSLGVFFDYIKDEKNVMKVRAILKDEEESFAKTWQTGLKHFETARANAEAKQSKAIAPEDAFVLHDRYGFPVDLTALLAEKIGMSVDQEAFQEEMKKHQEGGGRVQASKTFFDTYQVDELNRQGLAATNDSSKYVWESRTANVLAVFNKAETAFLAAGATVGPTEEATIGVVLDETNFYFECGGQVYDTGVITFPTGKFAVERVYSFGGFIVHVGKVTEGTIAAGVQGVTLDVDYVRRAPIAANHTTTHQLNHALREVLQFRKPDSFMEVAQRGSYVNEDSLRFDFSWNAKLTGQEVADVEACVTKVIADNLKVYSALVPLAEANAISSIRRNFEDKYPDPCTVISIGKPIEEILANPTSDEWKNYSIELCGGTHITEMGKVAQAVTISEESLTKGVRRMVMFTGAKAAAAAAEGAKLLADFEATKASTELDFDEKQKALSVLAKVVNDSEIPLLTKFQLRDLCDAAIKAVLADKKNAGAKAKEAAAAAGAAFAAQGPLTVAVIPDFGAEREPLQAFADAFLAKNPGTGIFLLGVEPKKDKAMAMTVMSKEAVAKGLSAVEWIKVACGKGGGKPNAAQMGVAASAAAEVSSKAQAAVPAMAAKLA